MQSIATIIAFCLLAGTSYASNFGSGTAYGFGKCNNELVKVQPALDLSQYQGKWFEAYRVPYLFEVLMKCVTAEYDLNADQQTANVTNDGFLQVVNQWVSIHGVASVVNATEPAKLQVQFSKSRLGSYWVLDTDYTTYSVVYSCHEIGPFRAKNAWILTRTAEPLDAEKLQNIFTTLKANNVDTDTLKAVEQTGCPPKP